MNTQEKINKIDERIEKLEMAKKAFEKKEKLESQIEEWKNNGLDDEAIEILKTQHSSKIGEKLDKVNSWLETHKELLSFLE